jgi:hypothetical protein
VTAPADITGKGLAALSVTAAEATGAVTPIFDGALTDPWAESVSGAPPSSHQIAGSEGSIVYAGEVVYAYEDTDGSGGASVGDTPLATICDAGLPVVLWWNALPTELLGAVWMQGFAMHAGWQAVREDETTGDPVVLTDTSALTLDDTCLDAF